MGVRDSSRIDGIVSVLKTFNVASFFIVWGQMCYFVVLSENKPLVEAMSTFQKFCTCVFTELLMIKPFLGFAFFLKIVFFMGIPTNIKNKTKKQHTLSFISEYVLLQNTAKEPDRFTFSLHV